MYANIGFQNPKAHIQFEILRGLKSKQSMLKRVSRLRFNYKGRKPAPEAEAQKKPPEAQK